MDLLSRILECPIEAIDSIIEDAINRRSSGATKVEKLGFLDARNSNEIFKGFIPLDTRIKYANLNMEDYSMNTTDFMYEYAHLLRKYNINNKGAFIHYLEPFINSYFGYAGTVNREDIFNDIAWNTTTTDEEYFEALKNNKIGDLKGKGAAECTERSAVAQQLLSLFGTESYYCIGCVDLGDKQEGHCFNVVKRMNDYAVLDYSVPVPVYDQNGNLKNYYPFVGILTNEEFSEFINSGNVKTFDEYCYVGNTKKTLDKQRMYVIGEYEIKKENSISSSL